MNATPNRADFRHCLCDCDTIAQTANCVVVMRAPARIFALPVGRHPQVCVLRKLKPLRQYADHREIRIIDFQMQLRQVRRRSEILLPVSVADESDRSSTFLAVTSNEITPDDRL